MKPLNILLITLFSLFAYNGFAQSQRSVSKDVQKISNKQFLKNERLLIVLSVDASDQTLSKGVQFVNNKIERKRYEGNMKSEFPVWIIGKDVNKIDTPKKVVEPINNKILPDVIVQPLSNLTLNL